MWICTNFGFFSIVQKNGEPDLTVRTRVATDLDALRERCPELSPTIATPMADYGYRATVSHAAFATCLSRLAHEITYHNFKDEVAAQQGYPRAKIYGRVWSALLELAKLN